MLLLPSIPKHFAIFFHNFSHRWIAVVVEREKRECVQFSSRGSTHRLCTWRNNGGKLIYTRDWVTNEIASWDLQNLSAHQVFKLFMRLSSPSCNDYRRRLNALKCIEAASLSCWVVQLGFFSSFFVSFHSKREKTTCENTLEGALHDDMAAKKKEIEKSSQSRRRHKLFISSLRFLWKKKHAHASVDCIQSLLILFVMWWKWVQISLNSPAITSSRNRSVMGIMWGFAIVGVVKLSIHEQISHLNCIYLSVGLFNIIFF